jgi:hypothetical protein
MCCYVAGQQLRVSKICESEMATKDTHLALWSPRATPGISASNNNNNNNSIMSMKAEYKTVFQLIKPSINRPHYNYALAHVLS